MASSIPMKPGQKLGAYELVMPIAEGGMGTIWKARHPHLDRWVAIKQIRTEVANDEQVRQAFIREVKNLSRLHSPQIVQVLDFGFSDLGQPYMVTEFLDGEDLRQRLIRETRLPLGQVLVIGIEVLKALSEAHAVGLVHRDLKPGNVFLQRLAGDGEEAVKVLDFGVAKLLSTDGVDPMLAPSMGVKGSPRYMAPEQVVMNPITPAADIYSFGATMYRMLTGDDVFVGTPLEILSKHVDSEPVPLRQRAPDIDADSGIEDLVMVCLRKKPEDRPLSAAALKTRLELMLSQLKTAKSRDPGRAGLDAPESTQDRDADSSLPSWFESTGSVSMAPEPMPSLSQEVDGGSSHEGESRAGSAGGSSSSTSLGASAQGSHLDLGQDTPEFPTLDTSIRGLSRDGFDSSRTIEDAHPVELLAQLELESSQRVDPSRTPVPVTPVSRAPLPITEPPRESVDLFEDVEASSQIEALSSGQPPRIQMANQQSGTATESSMTRILEQLRSTNPLVLVVCSLALTGLLGFLFWPSGKTPDSEQPTDEMSEVDVVPVKSPATPPPSVLEAPSAETPNVVRQLTIGPKKAVVETVSVTVEQGPARFVRIRDGKVLCRFEKMCQVPVDGSVRVYKKGFKALKLHEMDLHDRRNHRWRVILRR